MARVTSDETNQTAVSPGRVSSNEEQGVLGAGLPLLQRLKLLKEKEEKEERERARVKEEEEAKQKEAQEQPEEEPEVIGAGLPLFARLRLLKAKEEKERLEREEKERAEKASGGEQQDKETSGQGEEKKASSPVADTPAKSPTKETTPAATAPATTATTTTTTTTTAATSKPRPAGLLKGKLRAALLTSAAPDTNTSDPAMKTQTVGIKLTPAPKAPTSPGTQMEKKSSSEGEGKQQQPLKGPGSEVNKSAETRIVIEDGSGSPVPATKDVHANSNSVQGGQALERAFGKLLSKKANVAARTEASAADKSDTTSAKNAVVKEKPEKMNRSDSFKRAMDEGRIRSTDEHDLSSIRPHETVSRLAPMRESSADATTKRTEEKGDKGERTSEGKSASSRRSSDPGSARDVVLKIARRASAGLSKDGSKDGSGGSKDGSAGSKEALGRKEGMTDKREGSKETSSPKTHLIARNGTADRPVQKVDSLKVW